ncbi:hypothetical protein NEDG_00055 [Nematocida displodere]|uniref:Uncharacterized protein n=1 Tax=Nematocida displodere TaxID=1805483 RepID=A0A177EJM4_9MICR|nr:hypothetical protein NEDG_00055 [Nematocida displodere]
MKYTPPFLSVHLSEGVQTANKNIYSYFMKNDSSYYVPQSERYANYRAHLDTTYLVVVTQYTSATEDFCYKNNEESVRMHCLIGKTPALLQEKEVSLSRLIESIHEVEKTLPSQQKLKPGETFIGLVFPDGLNRVSVMNMVDSVVTHGGFKGVMVVPMSLAVSLGLGISNSVVVSNLENASVFCVEDNCLLPEGYIEGMACAKSLYGEDIVDDFLKREEVIKTAATDCVCHLCNGSFELGEFSIHFKTRHNIDVYAEQKQSDELLRQCAIKAVEEESSASPDPELSLPEQVARVLASVSPQERMKKVSSALIYITRTRTLTAAHTDDGTTQDTTLSTNPELDEAGAVKEVGEEKNSLEYQEATCLLDEPATGPSTGPETAYIHLTEDERNRTAWRGVYALSNIEPGRELWLTDKEWKSVGLRVLKEKVLFPL